MEPGETVHLIEEDCTYITDNCATRQVMRGRIEYPVDGWVSLKCLRDAVEEEDFVYKKGKVRSASAAKTTHDQGTVHVLVETDESDGNGEPGLRQDAKPHKRMQGMNAFARAATENLDESREPLHAEAAVACKFVIEAARCVAQGGRSLYEALGVEEMASVGDIKLAYRSLAKLHHPDRNNSEESSTIMAHLNDAYEVLVDDAQRHSYDSAVLRLREERQSGAASR